MDFQTLTKQCGENAPAGTLATLYLQKAGAFDSFPEPTATPSAAGDTKILTGTLSFVVTEPQGFAAIPIVVDSGDVLDTIVGSEPGSQGIENALEFRIAGNRKEQLEFADTLVSYSGCGVAIITSKQGDSRVIGKPDIPFIVESFEGSLGKKQGDPNGQTWKIKSSLGITAPILDDSIAIPII